MQRQSHRSATPAEESRGRRLLHRVDPLVGDDPELRALWAAAASAERDRDTVRERRVRGASLASGDLVRLAVREGSFRAGMTGVVGAASGGAADESSEACG